MRFFYSLYILVLFATLSSPLAAQSVYWAKQAGFTYNAENINDIASDAEGATYAAGFYNFNIYIDDVRYGMFTTPAYKYMLLIKYSKAGEVEWVFGNHSLNQGAIHAIEEDGQGNFIITGYFDSEETTLGNDVLVSEGSREAFVAKINAKGETLWAKSYGTSQREEGRSVAVDKDGNIYLLGIQSAYLDSYEAAFVAMYDPQGNLLWDKPISSTEAVYANDLDVDSKGNIIFAGGFSGTLAIGEYEELNPGKTKLFLAKLDNTGGLIWIRTAGGELPDEITNIEIGPQDQYYISGTNWSSSITIDGHSLEESGIFYGMYHEGGTLEWIYPLQGTNVFDSKVHDLAMANDGSFFLTGGFTGSMIFTKPNGEVVTYESWNLDIYLTKFDPDGNFLWNKHVKHSYNNEGRAVAVDPEGNLHLAGSCSGIFALDEVEMTVAYRTDIFTALIQDTNGLFPELAVYTENELIKSEASVYMGKVPKGERSAPKVFTIKNEGTDTLFLSGTPFISISGSTQDFEVDLSTTKDTLPAGESTTFSVTLSPKSKGGTGIDITFFTNDLTEPEMNINLSGYGAGPYIRLNAGFADRIENGAVYDLGNFYQGTFPRTVRMYVYNEFQEPEYELLLTGDPVIQLSQDPTENFALSLDYTDQSIDHALQGYEKLFFDLTFFPNETGEHFATITIPNNDDERSPFTFQVRANVPEVKVEEALLELSANDLVIAHEDTLDLGHFYIKSNYYGVPWETYLLTIKNTGATDLIFHDTKVLMNGADADKFNLNDFTLEDTLAPGASGTFEIKFRVDKLTDKATVDFWIESNAKNTIAYKFTAKAKVLPHVKTPTIQASQTQVSNVTDNSAEINWVNGNGYGRIVVISTFSTLGPSERTYFEPNTVYGLGDFFGGSSYVVANLEGNEPITVTGLTPGTSYYAAVFEYNHDGYTYAYARTGTSHSYAFTTPPAPNRAPENIRLSSHSIQEKQAVQTVVGEFSTEDPGGGNFTYRLVSGEGDDDNGSFSISENVLLSGQVFEYNKTSALSIRVQTTDEGGLSLSKVFTVVVENINDSPTDISLTNTAIDEGLPANTLIGEFSTADEDGGEFTYTMLEGPDAASFLVVGNQLFSGREYSFPKQAEFTIRIQTEDEGGLSYSKYFTITVNQVNHAPTDISLTNTAIDEGLPANTLIGEFSTADEDGGEFTYALVSGEEDEDNGQFYIRDNALMSSSSFSFSDKSTLSIRVKATDSSNLSVEKNFDIEVIQTLGIEGGLEKEIQIFPNPFESSVFIETPGAVIKEIRLYNAVGNQLATYKKVELDGNTEVALPENLPPGPYFLLVNTMEGSITKMMIKK